MTKRSLSILLALAVAAGVFSAVPAIAQDAPPPTVPPVVNIEDPKGDANYLNDQGVGLPLPGDDTRASAGTVSDILKAWFTSTPDTISAHILTDVAPPATTPLIFHVRVDPGTGTNCLWFRASFPSTVGGQSDPVVPRAASLRDTCPSAKGVQPGELSVGTTAESDGVITMTFPRSHYPTFTDGSVLKAPTADSRNFIGGVVTAPQIDNTKPGTDYVITSGGPVAAEPEPEPTEEPPGKSDPPGKGKKKGCKKGKGQKKGACPGKPKPPPAPACPSYVPGEKGAEAETVIVTDAATQEKPIEVEFDFGVGIPENPNQEHEYVHVQVVSDAQEPPGLYARFEFATYEDMDLYAYHSNGKLAARAAGYNPAPVAVLNDNTNGGHSEQGAEQIDGVRTNSCGGYTIDMVTFQNNSGKKKLKLWLGEGKNDPKPPEEEAAALATFFSLLGL